jgi:hypothetical protein
VTKSKGKISNRTIKIYYNFCSSDGLKNILVKHCKDLFMSIEELLSRIEKGPYMFEEDTLVKGVEGRGFKINQLNTQIFNLRPKINVKEGRICLSDEFGDIVKAHISCEPIHMPFTILPGIFIDGVDLKYIIDAQLIMYGNSNMHCPDEYIDEHNLHYTLFINDVAWSLIESAEIKVDAKIQSSNIALSSDDPLDIDNNSEDKLNRGEEEKKGLMSLADAFMQSFLDTADDFVENFDDVKNLSDVGLQPDPMEKGLYSLTMIDDMLIELKDFTQKIQEHITIRFSDRIFSLPLIAIYNTRKNKKIYNLTELISILKTNKDMSKITRDSLSFQLNFVELPDNDEIQLETIDSPWIIRKVISIKRK